MIRQTIFLDVYNIKAEINSSDLNFLQFVLENYPCFNSDNIISPNIVVNFSEFHGGKAIKKKKKLFKISKDLYRNKESIYWENVFGFSVLVTFISSDKWVIEGYHFDLNKNINKESRLKNYQRSMRWMIHFPIFLLLEKLQRKKLVHASSVSKNGKALIFAGLNGVGKSSLGRYLFKNHGYKYNSDNFLLTDGDKVFAFPERGRLNKDSIDKLQIKETGNNDVVYGKIQNIFSENEIEKEACPDYVFIISNYSKLNCVEISNTNGNKSLEGIHRYLKEFPE